MSHHMDLPRLRAALLIISDTAAKDPSSDKTGTILSGVFKDEQRQQWTLERISIVSDDIFEIQKAVITWCDAEDPVNLIITSGGTGFAVRDRTPEAVTPLLHRHASGLV